MDSSITSNGFMVCYNFKLLITEYLPKFNTFEIKITTIYILDFLRMQTWPITNEVDKHNND